MFFNILISLKSCSGKVLLKKNTINSVHRCKLSEVTQGNFDEWSFKQII